MLNMNKMRGLTVLVLAALTVTACASTQGKVGGDYGIVRFPGLPARNGYEEVPAAKWSPTEFRDLQDLQTACKTQLAPQIPSAAREIGLPTAKMALASAASTGLGAIAAFTGVTFKQYATYAGISMLGNGGMSYSDRYELAKRYTDYACMQFFTSQASRKGRLVGIGIIPWAGSGKMNGVPMPNNQPSRGDAPSDAKPADEPADDGALVTGL